MNFEFSKKLKTVCYILIAVGIITVIAGFMSGETVRTWSNLLIDNFLFLAIAVFGTFFVALLYLTESAWGVTMKRIPEAMSQFLWVAGVIMLLIFIGGHHYLYHWTHPELTDPASPRFDALITEKSVYLNTPFFLIRMVFILGIWIFCTHLLRKYSRRQDDQGWQGYHKKSRFTSAVFMVFFAVTCVVAAWDWLMSLEPHWYSTIFGWYVFGSLWVSGTAVAILLLVYLKRKNLLPNVNANHLHDMGKWLFALSCMWTYLWFSQFMLIWYANIPEEAAFYLPRIKHYPELFYGMLFVNFLLPFLVLMSRDSKRNTVYLVAVAILVFIGHWLDFYVLVMPATVGEYWSIGWIEAGILLGFIGGFLFVTFKSLTKASLEVKQHPFLQECVHHHV
ncbi:MAG: quinol:cytochrome C oxidoreductase [Bacteroidetes bacterium]|nr:quinol:cytochrome C oxidoreductase [Bacteroidota bacterium]